MKISKSPSQRRSEGFKFAGDVVWVGISGVLISCFGVLTLPALTKSYGTEQYGVWVQALVTVGLLTPFLNLQLSTAAVRYFAGQTDQKLRGTFGTLLLVLVLFSLPILLISVLAKTDLAILVFDNTKYSLLIPVIFLWAGTASLFTYTASYFRARRRLRTYSIFQLVSSGSQVLLLIVLAVRGFELLSIFFSQIAVYITCIFAMLTLVAREIGLRRPHIPAAKKYLRFGIPLIPTAIVNWILASSDRYFIVHYLNLSQSGIYNASYSLGSLVSLVFTPISFVLFPFISKFYEHKELQKVKNYTEYSTRFFLATAIPATVGLYFLANPLLKSLTTSTYAIGGLLTFLVAAGTVFFGMYQINVYHLLLKEKTVLLPLLTVASAGTSILLDILLIPRIGIIGAAFATVASYALLGTAVTVWTYRNFDYRIDFVFLSKSIAASVIMGICISVIAVNNLLQCLLIVCIGSAIYLVTLFLLRGFSEADKTLIKELLQGIKNAAVNRGA